VDDFLALARGFGAERDSGVMDALGQDLRFISDYLVTDADRPQYEAYVRSLLHPIAEEIGYRTAPNDSDGMKELRDAVLYTLGYAGRDPKVLQAAREMTDQAMSRSAEIDPSLFGHMVDVAAMYGDEALYERILAKLKDTNVPPNEYYTWAYALTSFRDPRLLARTLEYTAGPDVRNQDAPGMIEQVWANPAGRELGWSYVKTNWQALKPKLATYGYGEMAANTFVFCDVSMKEDVKSFFTQNSPEAKGVLGRSVERIDNCIRFRQQEETRLTAWLKQNSGTAAGQP
jgi:aminopeptidase N